MKKVFLLGAMVCALGMMTACKSGTADNKKPTLVGHWETVAATEEWDCSESPEYREMVAAGNTSDTTQYDPTLDSAEYRYISFDFDEDSITMVEHDRGCDPVPPLEITKRTVSYSCSGDTLTWFNAGNYPINWKIVELTADKLVFKDEYDLENCTIVETYTMKRK